MKRLTRSLRLWALLICAVSCVSSLSADIVVTHPYQGVTYIHRTDTSPRPVTMNIVEIDLTAPGVSFAFTPQSGARDTTRQTTLDFMNQQSAQVAVNGNFFTPFPSSDTTAYLVGLGASAGNVYSGFEPQPTVAGQVDQSYAIVPFAPGINIDSTNHAGIVHYDPNGNGKQTLENASLYTAFSGSGQIITNGVASVPYYKDATHPDGLLTPNGTYSNSNSWYGLANARTVVGLSQDNKTLVIFTDDKDGTSQGLNLSEVASILINDYHVYNALNMDGGGSTTLAMRDPTTHIGGIVNTSSDNPLGRSVGSNLAIFAQPIPEPATMSLLAGGAVLLLARRRRATRENQTSTRRNTMRGNLFVLAAIGAVVGMVGAGSVQASVIPYTQNFDSLAVGASLPNEVTGSVGGPTSTWSVVAPTGGNHWYENVLTSAASVKGMDSLQFTNLGPASSTNNFEVATVLKGITITNAGTINYTAGLRFLGNSATTTDDSYVCDLNLGLNAGRMRLVEFTGSTAVVYPSPTQSSQPLVPNFSLSKTYLLDVKGTYDASNALTVLFTVTDMNNSADTMNYTYSLDTTPRTGQFFGFYDSMSAGATSMKVDYDSLQVLPEPATLALLAFGGMSLLRRRR